MKYLKQYATKIRKQIVKRFKKSKRYTDNWLKKKKNKRKTYYALMGMIILGLGLMFATAQQQALAERQRLNSEIEQTIQKLEETKEEITELEEAKAKLETESSSKEKKLRQKEKQEQQYKQQIEELERLVEARRERERKLALVETAEATPVQPAASPTPSGNPQAWMSAAGIPESQWWAVDFIVSRESGWDPCAYNPGLSDCSATPSSACGLAQSLPCGKVNGHWTDPVANLVWQYQYVRDRYGGYPQAVEFWKSNHWY